MSFVIAFDNGAFFQYFGTQPDLAVELNEALNATGESTAPVVHKWRFQYSSAYHLCLWKRESPMSRDC